MTNHYTKGKFVRDGDFDANAVSKQAGAATILKALEEAGVIKIPRTEAEARKIATARSGPAPRPRPATSIGLKFEDILARLRTLLKPSDSDLKISIRRFSATGESAPATPRDEEGRPILKVGHEIIFVIESRLKGRLLLLDINAGDQVQQILPNNFTESGRKALISASEPVLVPDESYGFRAFRVGTPLGYTKVFALAMPEDFPVGKLIENQSRSGSITNIEQPMRYLTKLADDVENFVAGRKAEGASRSIVLPPWSMAVLEYKIE